MSKRNYINALREEFGLEIEIIDEKLDDGSLIVGAYLRNAEAEHTLIEAWEILKGILESRSNRPAFKESVSVQLRLQEAATDWVSLGPAQESWNNLFDAADEASERYEYEEGFVNRIYVRLR